MSVFYLFNLNGTQSGTASSAFGFGFGLFDDTANTLTYTVTFSGLDFGTLSTSFPNRETADTADDVTAAHIHIGARGANGGVAFNFLNDNDLTTVLNADGTWTLSGVWDASEGIGTFAADLGSTTPGSDMTLYFNIHTTTNPGGEIRGQFVSAADDTANTLNDTANNDVLQGLGGDDTINAGNSGNDQLIGGEGNDRLVSGPGQDTLIGGAGNDLLSGGPGADSMVGGTGNDDYALTEAGDVAVENPDEGTDALRAEFDLDLADFPNFENIFLSGPTDASATGSDANNVLYGTSGNNVLQGLGGNDTILGFGGNDTIDGGAGNDIIRGDINATPDGGADSIDGGDGADTLQGNGGNDTINGGNDGDTIEGQDGDDLADGGAGNDIVAGGSGADRLLGGTGEDALRGQDHNDTLEGGEGADTLDGGNGDDQLAGGAGNDSLNGGDGTDTAVFGVASTDITVARVSGGLEITSSEGVDFVANDVESFQFSNQTLTYQQVDDMVSASEDRFHLAVLDGTQSGSGSTASGVAYGNFQTSTGAVYYEVRIFGLDLGSVVPGSDARATEETADDVTALHIHTGARGANGGVAFNILGDDDLSAFLARDGSWVLRGTWDANEGADGFASVLGETTPGTDLPLYFNVHTTSNPGGELRGQLVSAADSGANSVTGGALPDTLNGLDGNDTLSGLGGDDLLNGGDGDDSLLGGDGDDLLSGGGGNDTMVGGAGDDWYTVHQENDVIIEAPDEGYDFVTSYAPTYTLGDNVEGMRVRGSGTPVGIGNDLDNALSTLSTSDTDTVLRGLGGNDRLTTANGQDTLEGGDGNDTLDGGDGVDSMVGGAGNDFYYLSEAADVVGEAADGGSDFVHAPFDLDLRTFTEIENLSLAGSDALNGIGTDGANTLYGNAGNNLLQGLGGNDTLFGRDGADTLEGGDGDDNLRGSDNHTTDTDSELLNGGAGNDTLLGAAGTDTLLGGTGDDSLSAQAGDDSLSGEDGNDTLLGDDGQDTLSGGQGDDNINGGADDDALSGDDGADEMSGGTGNDTLDGGAGNDRAFGNDGTDSLLGSDGDDTLDGGDGNDTLLGGADNDSLSGGEGDDSLDGGAGNDTLGGLAGDDTLLGGAGDDRLDGGDGTDTGVFGVASTEISVERVSGGLQITSSEGVDTILSSVESFQFTDQTLTYAQVDSMTETLVDRVHQFVLDGTQSGTASTAMGTGYGHFDATAGTMSYSLRVTGLDFGSVVPGSASRATADTSDDVTAMHIHIGARGASGGVAFNVFGDGDLSATLAADGSWLLTGIWDGAEGIGAHASDLGGTAPGDDVPLYFNIHTTTNPGGELRGQIVSSADAEANTIDGSMNADTLIGLEGNDQITGLDGNDLLRGGAGNDTLIGALGNDEVRGGAGNDNLSGSEGDDMIFLGLGNDQAGGGTGNDQIFVEDAATTDVNRVWAGDGMDRIQGNQSRDIVDGGNGQDTLIGGDGDDVLIGGTSETDLRDVVFAGNGNDSAQGGYGNDELRGDAGNDTLEGGFGADTVIGGTGNDLLTAGAWGDVLFGGSGDDFINGGFGFDQVNGGTGADRFFHQGVVGHGDDWLQDYTAAEGDVLVFGGGAATADDFLVQRATTNGAGSAAVQEVFVTYVPTGDLLWALVDGAAQTEINVLASGASFDLLA